MPTAKATTKKTAKKSATKKLAGPAAQKVTFEDVWAGLDRLEKLHQETEKALKKSVERLDRDMGRLGDKLGDIAEYTLVPDLPEKFKKFRFSFEKISRNIEFNKQGIHAQIDAMLENGTQAMVVEVKATLRPEDINDHIKRMEKLRAYSDLKGDKRQFFGAMAAMVIDSDTRIHAQKQGFFVIEPSGEAVKINPPFAGPKAW